MHAQKEQGLEIIPPAICKWEALEHGKLVFISPYSSSVPQDASSNWISSGKVHHPGVLLRHQRVEGQAAAVSSELPTIAAGETSYQEQRS